jgi:hypothetical protein
LIRDGLATASTGRVGRSLVEVVRIKITEAGRAALTPRSGSAPGMTGTPPLTGNFPSVPRIGQIMNTTNGKAEDGFGLEDGRRKIVSEIMRLSPPPQGCAQRARLVLENKFTFEELQVLVEALRDGIDAILEPNESVGGTSRPSPYRAARAPSRPNGGVPDSLDEAKSARETGQTTPIAPMTFLSQSCPAPCACKRGAFEPRQTLPSDAGAL